MRKGQVQGLTSSSEEEDDEDEETDSSWGSAAEAWAGLEGPSAELAGCTGGCEDVGACISSATELAREAEMSNYSVTGAAVLCSDQARVGLAGICCPQPCQTLKTVTNTAAGARFITCVHPCQPSSGAVLRCSAYQQ